MSLLYVCISIQGSGRWFIVVRFQLVAVVSRREADDWTTDMQDQDIMYCILVEQCSAVQCSAVYYRYYAVQYSTAFFKFLDASQNSDLSFISCHLHCCCHRYSMHTHTYTSSTNCKRTNETFHQTSASHLTVD